MKRMMTALGIVLVVLTATAAQAATLTIDAPASASKSDGTLTVSGTAGFDAPQRAQVFADGTLDDEVLLEATPPFQDLVAGFVEVDRSDELLNLTWQVVDLPDGLGGVPEGVRYMWEFAVVPPDGSDPVPFQVQAKYTNVIDRSGPQTTVPAGKLEGNCSQVGNLITCEYIGDFAVTFDDAANEITAHIPFSMLTAIDSEDSLIVDGAEIVEFEIFRGIVAISQVVLSYGLFGDVASASAFWVGEGVQLGLVPALGFSDDDAIDFMTDRVVPDTDGTFTHSFDITGPVLSPGDYEVAARACTDAACGPVVREPVTLTE